MNRKDRHDVRWFVGIIVACGLAVVVTFVRDILLLSRHAFNHNGGIPFLAPAALAAISAGVYRFKRYAETRS